MSKIEVNQVDPQSGTTLTLGTSGDTVSIPSGVTLANAGTVTGIPASAIDSGTMATARLGTGTADSTTFLRGDQTFASATPADNSITTAQLAYNPNPFRNIIINGDMSLAQRSTSVTGITGGGYNTLDRWNIDLSSLGTWTMSQSTDVPSGYGFATSLKLDCTTADASPAASNRFLLEEKFEGQNLQYLKKGTSNAESLTASFWVKSTKTGTFIAGLYDVDNNRNVSKSYTVSDSNTWEFKTVTFPGDTSGALDNDNAASLSLQFWLAAGTDFTSGTLATSWAANDNTERAVGQVNIADNTANDFFITGTQLEAGTTASDFEFLPVDVNLQRCYRYYEVTVSGNTKVFAIATAYTASGATGVINFKTTKRATPTLDAVTGSDYYEFFRAGTTPEFSSFSIGDASVNLCYISGTSSISTTAGYSGYLQTNNPSSFIAFDSEL